MIEKSETTLNAKNDWKNTYRYCMLEKKPPAWYEGEGDDRETAGWARAVACVAVANNMILLFFIFFIVY